MRRATVFINFRRVATYKGLDNARATSASFATNTSTSSRPARSWRQPVFATVAVAAGALALSAYLEPAPDESELPREYDIEALTCYWQARPWAVRKRCLEVVWELLPLTISVFIDKQRGLTTDNDVCHRHAVKTREALTRLGPAFIKLGQALSIRPDLMPAVALKELQQLCDACPAFAWEFARAALEEELGCDVNEIFEGLENCTPEPIAAASIGQVYRWRLRKDGSVVAVKVQRPNMANAVSLDLYILRCIAQSLRAFIRCFTKARIDHVALLDAWATGTTRELDYIAEARNQERFREALVPNFKDRIYVPAVRHELTTRHVLVSEWVNGPRLADCSADVVRKLCPVGVECFMAQLLDLGLFHSDPHPGNLLVSDDGLLVLLDFGLVAEIDDINLHRHATAVVNLINANYDELLDDFIALGFLPEDIDKKRLLPPIQRVLEQGMKAGADMKRRKKNFQAISDDLNDIFFEFPFMVPAYFALVTRALATLEGIALVGDPEFDIFWAAYPFALSRVTAILGAKQTSGLMSAAAAHAAQSMTAPERAQMVWAAARTVRASASRPVEAVAMAPVNAVAT